MSDQQTNSRGAAADALAGQPAGGEQTSGTGQPTNGSPAPGSTPAQQAAWYASLAPEIQGKLEGKGWNTPTGLEKLTQGYFDIEKAYRAGDKVMLPKDDNDKEGYDALFNRLGRPESADKYKFPEGVDANAIKALAPKLHELGITQKQAAALAQLDIERQTQAQAEMAARSKADQDAAMPKLEREWGPKFPENVEFARRAMRGLGMNLDRDFMPMAAAIGAEKAMKLLHLAGMHTREDNAANIGDAQAGFGLTPNRAKAELAEKGGELLKRARAGDKAAAAHRLRLIKAISGDGMVEF